MEAGTQIFQSVRPAELDSATSETVRGQKCPLDAQASDLCSCDRSRA